MGSRRSLLIALLLCARLAAQETAAARASREDYFSGLITATSNAGIAVTRSVLGNRLCTRAFIITPETRMEGKPKINAKVTVRFVAEEKWDRAVHIIVRPAAPRAKR